jgi:hypothetical protein
VKQDVTQGVTNDQLCDVHRKNNQLQESKSNPTVRNIDKRTSKELIKQIDNNRKAIESYDWVKGAV